MSKWLIGFHPVEETLKVGVSQGTLYLCGSGQRYDKLIRLAKKNSIPFRNATKQKLKALTSNQNARDCALEIFPKEKEDSSKIEVKAKTIEEYLENLDKEDKSNATVLILDSITDPHNLGAILRSADQFGVDCVIMPQRGSAKENATVMKTSAGAARYVKSYIVPNLTRTAELLKNYNFWIYGADMGGTQLNKSKLTGRTAIIMGSEGKGIRQLLASSCDSMISIPTCGNIDSLNVSVACGIILYEIHTQKLIKD